MSGIVGALNLDGAPIDRELLQQLTNSLTPRGPDAQRIWTAGPVGFGHTLFKTTEKSDRECQPFTLGNGTWITADARVDAQPELIEHLTAQGQEPAPHATDAELILRAYEVWGESCVEHLMGDFAFGIWSSRRQQLFCARDHMGATPFYYAQIGSFVVFSSTINCIRHCPAISDRLNDLPIADFLLFGLNQDSATTCFADIQRLPPAHCMSWFAGGRQIRRYWTMPVDEPVFYKRKNDYCDRFNELVRLAVGDRLRTPRIGVFMSGGLDSPTLAATARDILRERYSSFSLLAITDIDDFKSEEGEYAGMVAKHLGIPIHYDKWDDTPVDTHWERTPFLTAEPCAHACNVIPNREYWQKAGLQSRVFFEGEGPDEGLLFEWLPYLSYLGQRRLYGRLIGAMISTLLSERRPPFWGRIARQLKRFGPGIDSVGPFPAWLDPDFESRLQLRARWGDVWNSYNRSHHPVRPRGYAAFHTAVSQFFEGEDSAAAGIYVERRHPFQDIRLIRFLLTVPALPWCRSKYLMRRAMRGRLPDPVLRRKKSGLPVDRLAKRLASFGLEPFRPAPEVLKYVNPRRVPDIANDDSWVSEGHSRVRSLNHWLYFSKKQAHNIA